MTDGRSATANWCFEAEAAACVTGDCDRPRHYEARTTRSKMAQMFRDVRSMPAQKPGRSKQDYGTPVAFLRAVEHRWGFLSTDLAATAENAKAPSFITPEQNSLAIDWDQLPAGLKWLNPPFANIGEWAEKCSKSPASQIIMLTPASVGTEWYANFCHGKCRTVFIRPRLTFEGCTDPYPKDCMLTLWNLGGPGESFELWKWNEVAT